MKVVGKVNINSNKTFVVNKFLDTDFLCSYDKSITKYEITEGKSGQVNSITKFTRNFGGRILIEDRQIIDLTLHDKVVLKITVPGTSIIQENTFEAKGGETIWTQTSEYKLPFIMHWFVKLFKKKAFEDDTLFQMNKFKDAIEKN